MGRVHPVVDERFPGHRHPLGDDFLTNRAGKLPDFPLCMQIHPQGEEVQQIVQVRLPVGLGVGRKREVLAGLLAGHTCFEPFVIDLAGERLQLGFAGGQDGPGFRVQRSVTPLPVPDRLQPPFVGSGDRRRIDRHRVARRVLVDRGRAVANPLAPDVHRHPHVELDIRHLERRRVRMAKEVADQGPILTDALGANTIGDTGRLDDRVVVAHVIDHAHEAIVEHLEWLAEHGVERRNGGTRNQRRFVWCRHGGSVRDNHLVRSGSGQRSIRSKCTYTLANVKRTAMEQVFISEGTEIDSRPSSIGRGRPAEPE